MDIGPYGDWCNTAKKVYTEMFGQRNARRVREAILEGANIRQAKQGPSFLSPNTLKYL